MTLRLESVAAGYGDTTVLRDVSLTVPAGRVVALLGPNGAGKTTLLRVASGQLRPSAGRLLLHDVDRTGQPGEALAAAGVTLIPEGRGIFRNLSVREHIRLFARPDDPGALERVVGAFPRLGERLDQAAGTLSGGEQQMLALGRAHARPTSVLLLDEVSMGLAPQLVDAIYEALAELAATGVSLLVVEQFAARALALADVVYLLAGGRVQFAGEPGEVDEERLAANYFGVAPVS
jgi:branched-chain amino acid transport system ATP-binding protein